MSGADSGRIIGILFLALMLLGSGAVVVSPTRTRTATWLGREPRDIGSGTLMLWRVLAVIVFLGSVIAFATGHWPTLK
jgi:hypothetical protein